LLDADRNVLRRDELAAMERQLDEWSARMDNLVVKAHEIWEDAKGKYRQQVSVLQTWSLEGQRPEVVTMVTEASGEQREAERETEGGTGAHGLDGSVQGAF
jgi:hypothetical protein